jgi:large subunit ribosomal protein L14
MKAVSSNPIRSIPLKARLVCADNSGAKTLELINVRGYHMKLRRIPKAGIGDIIICSVKKGKEKIRHEVVYAVIVRQKQAYKRSDGTRVKFEDNAAVLVNPKTFEPIGTEIRSVIAKEVVERFTPIGKIASMVM